MIALMNVRPGCADCGTIAPRVLRTVCQACFDKRAFWWKAWQHFVASATPF